MKLKMFCILASSQFQETYTNIQKEVRKSTANHGEHQFEIYRNTLLGLDDSIKKLWEIIDSPKTEAKEKIKAITLLKACFKERLDLIKSEPGLIQQKKLMDEVKLFRT
jgi:predicted rRNA methylase YqxC with S4 and FtsJ domains